MFYQYFKRRRKDTNNIIRHSQNFYFYRLKILRMSNAPQVFHKDSEIKKRLANDREMGLTIGFVPTMGALHEGHLELVRVSLSHCDRVVVSIFVNPRQFNNPEDLKRYPRTLEGDTRKLEKCGCHYLYTPDEKEVYKNERPQQWHFGEGQRVMEGRFRPGHFEGMLSVVHLLLSTINPNDLFMGEKDFQQAWLVRRLVSALHSGTRFHLVDTVREPDGLAMSSRNGLLSDEERKLAATIPFALRYISEQPDFGSLRKGVDTMSARLMSEGIQLEYLELRDENELKEMTDQKLPGGRVFFAGMAGKVRLIDNVKLRS